MPSEVGARSRVSRASRDLQSSSQRQRGFVLCVPVFFSLSFSVP